MQQVRHFESVVVANSSNAVIPRTSGISIKNTGTSGVVTAANTLISGEVHSIAIAAGETFSINPATMPNAAITVSCDSMADARVVYWRG